MFENGTGTFGRFSRLACLQRMDDRAKPADECTTERGCNLALHACFCLAKMLLSPVEFALSGKKFEFTHSDANGLLELIGLPTVDDAGWRNYERLRAGLFVVPKAPRKWDDADPIRSAERVAAAEALEDTLDRADQRR